MPACLPACLQPACRKEGKPDGKTDAEMNGSFRTQYTRKTINETRPKQGFVLQAGQHVL